MQPRISVVVPSWNEAESLPALLESVRRQSLPAFEVLVADSGSTDGTEGVVDRAGFRYLPGPRLGPGEGRNRGARAASGDVLLFVDADCRMPPDLLAGVARALEDATVIGGATRFLPEDGNVTERLLFFLANGYQSAMTMWGFPHNAGFCFFFRKASFERLGGIREDMLLNETHDIALRSRALGRFVNLPVAVSTSPRRFRQRGLSGTILHEYVGSTLVYYATGRTPATFFRPKPVR